MSKSKAQEEKDRNEVKRIAAKGTEMAKEGRFKDAIKYFDVAIDKWLKITHELNDKLYINRAFCHESVLQLGEAFTDAQTAVNINSKNPKAHLRMAQILFKLNQLAKAEEAFKRVLELDPICEESGKQLIAIRAKRLEEFGLDKSGIEKEVKKLRRQLKKDRKMHSAHFEAPVTPRNLAHEFDLIDIKVTTNDFKDDLNQVKSKIKCNRKSDHSQGQVYCNNKSDATNSKNDDGWNQVDDNEMKAIGDYGSNNEDDWHQQNDANFGSSDNKNEDNGWGPEEDTFATCNNKDLSHGSNLPSFVTAANSSLLYSSDENGWDQVNAKDQPKDNGDEWGDSWDQKDIDSKRIDYKDQEWDQEEENYKTCSDGKDITQNDGNDLSPIPKDYKNEDWSWDQEEIDKKDEDQGWGQQNANNVKPSEDNGEWARAFNHDDPNDEKIGLQGWPQEEHHTTCNGNMAVTQNDDLNSLHKVEDQCWGQQQVDKKDKDQKWIQENINDTTVTSSDIKEENYESDHHSFKTCNGNNNTTFDPVQPSFLTANNSIASSLPQSATSIQYIPYNEESLFSANNTSFCYGSIVKIETSCICGRIVKLTISDP